VLVKLVLIAGVVVMLPPLRANERDQLQLHMYMSGSKGTDEGRPGC
jgi:hypothetical protein